MRRAEERVLIALLCFLIWTTSSTNWLSVSAAPTGTFPIVPQQLISVSVDRVGYSAVVVNDFLYVLGGFDVDGESPLCGVDVYHSQNGSFIGSITSMTTCRGYMSVVVVNETTLFAIGGSSTLSPDPSTALSVIETLTLDSGSGVGYWTSWGELFVPRLTPATTVVSSQSIMVALGSLDSSYESVVEMIDVNDKNGATIQVPLPENIESDCNGTLSLLDSSSVVLFCTSILNASPSSYLLNMTADAWETLPSTPLSSWYPVGIAQVDSLGSLYVSQTIEGASIVFTLDSGSISLYCQPQYLSCTSPNILIATSTTWICVSSTQSLLSNDLTTDAIRTPQWPQWGGNAQHTGQSANIPPSSCNSTGPFKLNWMLKNETQSSSATSSTAAVIGWDGSVYYARTTNLFGTAYQVVGLDGRSGSVKWQLEVSESIVGSPALNSEGILFFAGSSVFAVDSVTGQLIWKQISFGSVAAVILQEVEDDPPSSGSTSTLFVGVTSDGWPEDAISAIDGTDGELMWHCECALKLPTVSGTQPVMAVYDDFLYFGINFIGPELQQYIPSIVVGLNSTDQKRLWTLTTPNPLWIEADLIVGPDNILYFAMGDWASESYAPELYAVDGFTGQILWTSPIPTNFPDGLTMSLLSCGEHSLLVVVTRFGIRAYDTTKGDLVWETPLTYPGLFQPVLSSDNSIIVGQDEPHSFSILALDFFTGTIVASYTVQIEGADLESIVADRNGNVIAVWSQGIASLSLTGTGWTSIQLFN